VFQEKLMRINGDVGIEVSKVADLSWRLYLNCEFRFSAILSMDSRLAIHASHLEKYEKLTVKIECMIRA
jgi:hypothetical protein